MKVRNTPNSVPGVVFEVTPSIRAIPKSPISGIEKSKTKINKPSLNDPSIVINMFLALMSR
jgi:hypothetical protein